MNIKSWTAGACTLTGLFLATTACNPELNADAGAKIGKEVIKEQRAADITREKHENMKDAIITFLDDVKQNANLDGAVYTEEKSGQIALTIDAPLEDNIYSINISNGQIDLHRIYASKSKDLPRDYKKVESTQKFISENLAFVLGYYFPDSADKIQDIADSHAHTPLPATKKLQKTPKP